MVKKLSLILGFIFLTSNIQSQIVRFVDHPFQSDVIIYFTKYRYNAEIRVHLTPYIYKANNTPGIWFVNGKGAWYSREIKIYETKHLYNADLIVYLTPYEYDIKVNREYLLYWP